MLASAQHNVCVCVCVCTCMRVCQLMRYTCSVQVYADQFEREKVRLHNLLGMDHSSLERLGVRAIGEQDTIINGVYEYLRAYLRAAEPYAAGSK